MSADYRDTVTLPKTAFPMKAGLPTLEPKLLQQWEKMDLFKRQRKAAVDWPKFTLHDGPPYANGHLHIGTALNKILKDVTNRSQQMLGRDANYVPGWDCHGLPIEWKIEEEYRAKGRDKDAVPIIEFRRECREFAEHWIKVQREEFERLGVLGDWDHPYTTMAYEAEAQIAAEIGKFLMNGSLYRGSKPVLWSVVERTALAEAEVEYQDHTSTTIWVRFPVVTAPRPALEGASAVVWTTTPWTIPGNRGIAYGADLDYLIIKVSSAADGSPLRIGEKLVVAAARLEALKEEIGLVQSEVVESVAGRDLSGTVCAHPIRGDAAGGYDFDVPFMEADFVTLDQGSGLVHVAPGHGADDFVLGQSHGLEVPQTVAEDGRYYDHVPLFAGMSVYRDDGKTGDADSEVVAALERMDTLLASGRLTHSYPHSWRSKAPLIFRNTDQWFISMESTGLRSTVLDAIKQTTFFPPSGQVRLASMIENRPDWCISRQRAWGVPIAVFTDKETGEPLRDQKIVDRIVAAFRDEGADAWFTSEPSRFLGDDYDAALYEQVTDVVDVWFDSGSTHSFVLENREDLAWPASLYLEGSDQHRGWFQSSILESCGTRGAAPFEGVLTHGFVMAEDGRKMSKSLGNNVSPLEVVERHGAETLRLWVVASDYAEDVRIGPEIIQKQIDTYRRLRNTLRYLLGNLGDHSDTASVSAEDMPELERWVLHRLWQLDRYVRQSCETYDFHDLFRALYNFCAIDLSAFYFDIRKDCLYCDHHGDPLRCATLTVLEHLFDCLTAWLAPILCFTAEEAWLARNPESSVHLRRFPDVPEDWQNDVLAEKWEIVRQVRRVITGALEIERGEKRLGSSLQAAPEVYLTPEYAERLDGVDLATVGVTSAVTIVEGPAPDGAFVLDDVSGVGVVVQTAVGEKCERCWRILPDVGSEPELPDLCGRCVLAVRALRPAAE